MNEKKKLLILVAALVVLVGGAYVLYSALGDKLEMPGLVVQNDSGEGNAGSESDAQTDEAATESGAGNGNASGGSGAGASESGENAGEGGGSASEENAQELAPDFTVYDGEGNAHKLSDFRGKPVVVNFWASWCGPCKSEMPDFQEIYETYGEEIHFLMVNMTDGAQETVESASEFIEESGYTFPIYYDMDMDATYTYGVFSIPTTYFFDADGYGIAYGQGAMDAETILRGIEMIYPEVKGDASDSN